MVERSEIITICRQISGMMEAGVDILRITKVLRAQTENPRLLEFYDQLDHDLKMGISLPDALGRAPDLFSPFAISLVRESEDPLGRASEGLGSAFVRIADYLQKEENSAHEGHGHAVGDLAETALTVQEQAANIANYSLLTVSALDGLIDHIQLVVLRALTITAGLFLALGCVWASVEAGWLDARWQNVTLCSVGALFIGGAGIWVRRSMEADRKRGARCSFCGRTERAGARLQQAARYAGANICADCAAEAARRAHSAGRISDPVALRATPLRPLNGQAGSLVHATALGQLPEDEFEEDIAVWDAQLGHHNRIAQTVPMAGDDPVLETFAPEAAPMGTSPLHTSPVRNGRNLKATPKPAREADYE